MKYIYLTLLLISVSFSQVLNLDDLDKCKLQWTVSDSGSAIDHFNIYRSVDNSPYVLRGTMAEDPYDSVQTYLDSLEAPGILYSYYVSITDVLGRTSIPSSIVSEAIPITYPMPNYEITGGEIFPMITLTSYAFDLNGDELFWTALNEDDSIRADIVGDNAIISYIPGFRGQRTITFVVTQTDTLRAFYNFTSAIFTVKEEPIKTFKRIWISK